jgi:protein-disulfide isomerase
LYEIPKDVKTLDIKDLAWRSGVSFEGLAASPDIRRVRYKIKWDVLKGIELGVTGTPTYEMDGELFEGRIPLNLIKPVIAE